MKQACVFAWPSKPMREHMPVMLCVGFASDGNDDVFTVRYSFVSYVLSYWSCAAGSVLLKNRSGLPLLVSTTDYPEVR